MGYTAKRFLRLAFVLIVIALFAGGIFYVIDRAVSTGEAIKEDTERDYRYADPAEGAIIPVVAEGVCGSDLKAKRLRDHY